MRLTSGTTFVKAPSPWPPTAAPTRPTRLRRSRERGSPAAPRRTSRRRWPTAPPVPGGCRTGRTRTAPHRLDRTGRGADPGDDRRVRRWSREQPADRLQRRAHGRLTAEHRWPDRSRQRHLEHRDDVDDPAAAARLGGWARAPGHLRQRRQGPRRRLGRDRPYGDGQAAGHRPRDADRLGLDGDQVGDTKHHGGPTRRSTRSPARTSTGGRRARPRDPRRAVRREPHDPRHRRQRGRGGGAVADRQRPVRGRDDEDPVQRLQELAATQRLRRQGLGEAVHAARPPGPYLRVLEEGSCRQATTSSWSTSPGTA